MPNFIPKEALDYIKNKNLKVGFSYKDVWHEEHATSFTVAKAMQIDVLDDIKKAVEKAIENGETFESFKKNLKPTLIQKGWWGRKNMIDPLTGDMVNAQLGCDRRLKTIYNVNIRSAYQKGQYERTMSSDLHPYLMYMIGNSLNHRDQHLAWNGLILPKDDPFWNAHLPPNGYGCKCYTRAVTEARKKRYEKDGIRIPPTANGNNGGILRVKTKAPKEEYYNYYNERKGTVERVPKGVHPSFNWNHGKAGRDMAGLKTLIEKAEKKCPEQLEPLVKSYLTNTVFKKNFDSFVEKAYSGKIKGDFTTPVGFIDKDINRWLKKNKGINIGDSNIIALEARLFAPGNPKADRHSRTGDAIGKNGAGIIIDAILYGDVYFDKASNNLIYLFPHSASKLIKLTVSTKTTLKTRQTAIDTPCIRNLQTINASEKDGEFLRITKHLEKIK